MWKSIEDAMTSEVRTADPSQSLSEVALMMKQEDVASVPVVDGGRLIGMVLIGEISMP